MTVQDRTDYPAALRYVEPTLAHRKSDFRMARSYLRGFARDSLNLLLVAAAWNFRKWRRLWRLFFQLLILALPRKAVQRLQVQERRRNSPPVVRAAPASRSRNLPPGSVGVYPKAGLWSPGP